MSYPSFAPQTNRGQLPLAVWSALLATFMAVSPVSIAQNAGPASNSAQLEARDYAIAAGPLSRALSEFAGMAGVRLSFDAERLRDMQSPGLTGRYSIDDGFDILLQQSGYRIGKSVEGYVLTPIPVENRETLLGTVKVKDTAVQETANSPVQGFVARRSATGTKTDTPTLEIPQSISVITSDELEARGVNLIVEALRYVPGVTTSVYGQDDRGWEWFSIRGFGSSYSANYLDGLRQVGINYISPQNEPAGLERIEILRGPSSVMFGQGDAGGIVNRMSKRPDRTASNKVEVQLGNYDRHQLSTDVGGGLDSEGKTAWRLIAVGLDVEPQIDYPDYDERNTKRINLAPSLAWNPSDDTSLVLLTDYLRIRSTSNATEYLGADRKRTRVLTYDPSYDLHDQEQWSAGYQLEHHLNSTWTARQNLRATRNSLELKAVLGDNLTADALGDIPRYALRFVESLRYITVDNQLQGNFSFGEVEHTTLLGIDWMQLNADSERYFGDAPTLNLFNPVYGRPFETPGTPIKDGSDKQYQLGFYAQDQIKLGRHWRLTAGLRHDRVRTESDDRLGNLETSDKDSANTGRLGLNYIFDSGWAPYASYTESFLPEVGSDFDGNRFEPTQGRQYETGIKYQPVNGNGMITAAVFDLTKSNVQTRDPVNEFFTIQSGEQRSRGLELELKQEFSASWSMLAQYTYIDSEITEDSDNEGNRAPDVPRQLASAWLNYKVQGGILHGLGAGLGVRYVGASYVDAANTVENPSRTLVDGTLNYDIDSWRLGLSVNNLLDKDYLAHVTAGYPGSRRTVIGSLAYHF